MKRLLLLGDGRTDDGSWRRMRTDCTPVIGRNEEGALHILLSRGLKDLYGKHGFAWITPLPNHRGNPTSWGSLEDALKGANYYAPYPLFQAYSKHVNPGHGVDVAVLVPDSEDDEPAVIRKRLEPVIAAAAQIPAVPKAILGIKEPCTEKWLLPREPAPVGRVEREKHKEMIFKKFGSHRSAAAQVDLQSLVKECQDFAQLLQELSTTV